MNNGKNIKVLWLDAKLYSGEVPNKFDLVPTKMETVGFLHSENGDGVVIEKPKTTYEKNGNLVSVSKQEGATFLFIPRGMVVKIVEL